MKRDIVFTLVIVALFGPFFLSSELFALYEKANAEHGLCMSFVKFAVLATLGEVIALRIRTGSYYQKGFGVLPRAVVWGLLGLTIKFAFTVFVTGVPAFLQYLDLPITAQVMRGPITPHKFLGALSISAAMNLVYAPILMTLHKITDEHITRHDGRLTALLRPIAVGDILSSMNWSIMWNFVFKKTIPLFWIPAHTITFLLPAQHRVLFAALLGIALGVILAIASLRSRVAAATSA